MEMSLIDKIFTIFKFTFSSFLSIGMFTFCLLLLSILIVNLKKNDLLIQLIVVSIFLGFILGTVISYTTYVKSCVDSLTKLILNYIYFPSTIVYFFIIIFVTVMILYTIFGDKIHYFKKIFNFVVFSIIYYFFMSFISLATYDSVDLLDVVKLYQNNTILSLVQISNLLLIIWFIVTGFYHLYFYLSVYNHELIFLVLLKPNSKNEQYLLDRIQ